MLDKLISKVIDSQSMQVYEKMADGLSLRQRTIANNLANANTPNFKAGKVSFEEELKSKIQSGDAIPLKTSRPNHLNPVSPDFQEVRPRVFASNELTMRNDGNNVDVDAEMAELAKTQIIYNVVTDKINSGFSKYKKVLSETK